VKECPACTIGLHGYNPDVPDGECNHEHRQVLLALPAWHARPARQALEGGKSMERHIRGTIAVDILVAPLVTHLWDHGVQTEYSCQGDDEGLGYVAYLTSQAPQAEKLLSQHVHVIEYADGPGSDGGRSSTRFSPLS
jgi:hypothetical protein